ncbi:MAG TPA: CBS domain-containing protein [Pseudonocardia sp.]|jgi:CBS domain-containing protein|uniref:CBS domain-containing protein n=1 Tax=Pseudonocardia sp. TaxID=60912 RepID=UPI002B4B7F17|nr:CBS domain-containing protein [Pseudonocardia sp.]HLU58620.1 CBS domain-containing protein [Pseudonocardia sp.]
MKARDVMSSPVVFLRPQVPTDVAAALLLSHGYSAAPVVDDDGRVVGITTEADLLRGRFHPDRWEIDTGPEPPVGEVMTRDPICLGPDADLAEVVSAMLDAGIRSVPIVENGRPVGIVSRRDVLRVVARGRAAAG